ncbi:MAG: hypothetical protein IPM54_13020 [Polyangiaceae bacterium]|nr:hypothetical protein [Polyangiaceae bacterium]
MTWPYFKVIAGYDSKPLVRGFSTLRDIEKERFRKWRSCRDAASLKSLSRGSELSFGLGLTLQPNTTQIWHRKAHFVKAFPNVPKKYRTRANIAGKLQDIRKLRNRISHHQPIFKMESLPQLDKNILEIIGWLSPNMLLLLPVGEAFVDVYARGHDAYAVPIRHANSASQTGAAAN